MHCVDYVALTHECETSVKYEVFIKMFVFVIGKECYGKGKCEKVNFVKESGLSMRMKIYLYYEINEIFF